MILRITTFRWGDYCLNWYHDPAAVQRQLQTEIGRAKSSDIIAEDWYEAKRIADPHAKTIPCTQCGAPIYQGVLCAECWAKRATPAESPAPAPSP